MKKPRRTRRKKLVLDPFEPIKLSGGLKLWLEPNPVLEMGTVFGPKQTSARYVITRQTYNDGSTGPQYDAEGTCGGAKTTTEARQRAIQVCRATIRHRVGFATYKDGLVKIVQNLIES